MKKLNILNITILINNKEKVTVIKLEDKNEEYVLYSGINIDEKDVDQNIFIKMEFNENITIMPKKKYVDSNLNIIADKETNKYKMVLNNNPVYYLKNSKSIIVNNELKLILPNGTLLNKDNKDNKDNKSNENDLINSILSKNINNSAINIDSKPNNIEDSKIINFDNNLKNTCNENEYNIDNSQKIIDKNVKVVINKVSKDLDTSSKQILSSQNLDKNDIDQIDINKKELINEDQIEKNIIDQDNEKIIANSNITEDNNINKEEIINNTINEDIINNSIKENNINKEEIINNSINEDNINKEETINNSIKEDNINKEEIINNSIKEDNINKEDIKDIHLNKIKVDKIDINKEDEKCNLKDIIPNIDSKINDIVTDIVNFTVPEDKSIINEKIKNIKDSINEEKNDLNNKKVLLDNEVFNLENILADFNKLFLFIDKPSNNKDNNNSTDKSLSSNKDIITISNKQNNINNLTPNKLVPLNNNINLKEKLNNQSTINKGSVTSNNQSTVNQSTVNQSTVNQSTINQSNINKELITSDNKSTLLTYISYFNYQNITYKINTIRLNESNDLNFSNLFTAKISKNNIINKFNLSFELDKNNSSYLFVFMNQKFLINKINGNIVLTNIVNRNSQIIKNREFFKILNYDFLLYNDSTLIIPMTNKKIFDNNYGTSYNLYMPRI